jgi:hypothetical protein
MEVLTNRWVAMVGALMILAGLYAAFSDGFHYRDKQAAAASSVAAAEKQATTGEEGFVEDESELIDRTGEKAPKKVMIVKDKIEPAGEDGEPAADEE